jgi:Domain of Unknown Function (DUF1206)
MRKGFLRKKTAARSAKRRSKASPAGRAVSWLGRAGYAARGAIYLMVGFSAGLTTLDPSHQPGGFTESLKMFRHGWLGGVLLVFLALGLGCLAGWLIVSAVYRRDHPGRAHIVLVAGLLGDAAVYVAFMGSVLGLLLGARSGGGEDELQSWIAWLIGSTFGAAIVATAGAVVLACGGWLIGWGAVGDIEGALELPGVERELVLPVGRYGTGGRGAAIALVAATSSSPRYLAIRARRMRSAGCCGRCAHCPAAR